MNSVLKVGLRMSRLLDQRQSKESVKQVVTKPREEPPKAHSSGYRKDLIIESLKSCVANGAKNKQKSGSVSDDKPVANKRTKAAEERPRSPPMIESPKKSPKKLLKKSIEYLDSDVESMDSIPDSFGDQSHTGVNDTKEEDNTELVSVILEGLESNNERLSIELDSTFASEGHQSDGHQSDRLSQKKLQTKATEKVCPKVFESKSCQMSPQTEDRAMQTLNETVPKKVLKSISTQFCVSQTNQSIQTVDVVVNDDTNADKPSDNCCESNNCCFHKFIHTIPCHSLQTFLKQMVEFKDNAINKENQLTVNRATDPSSGETIVASEPSVNAKQTPESQDSVIVIEKPTIEKQNVEEIEEEKKVRGRVTSKRGSIESNKRSKKLKTAEPVVDLKDNEVIEENKDFLKILELNENPKTNENVMKEPNEPKGRKRVAKPKSKQKATVEESIAEEDNTVADKEVPKSKANVRKSVKKSNQTMNAKKTANMRSVEESAEELADDNVFAFEDKPEDNAVVKQTAKRKAVAKKSTKTKANAMDEEPETDKEMPLEVNERNSRRRQLISTDSEDLEKLKMKTTKSMPKHSTAKKPDKGVFKRPASPTPSDVSDISMASSTSSRTRSSSSERSKEHKYCILNSGLDDKQKKKIQSVCRTLNAEAVEEWSDRVTHLVIALTTDGAKQMVCPRNAKYLKALLGHKWILTFDWITDSYRSNRFVDELKYEISADRSATETRVPYKSRTTRQKLFENLMVQFNGIKDTLLAELQQMVTIGGGVVVNSIDEFEKNRRKTGVKKLIIVSDCIGLANTQSDGVKYMARNTFMESMSNFNPF
ncbi:unnamed protein product [Oppiella nova]|uniref:BRCT domain-containing protein n=1 Tax=Oppiella nova TaxID=334625 RepID=A0A7R9LYI7_9ACAR|nr:unnamed protein product [Oppiella nova]CAG2168241.1 unnamed protein product [Oppiella nova]